MTISVIVPAYRAETTIGACLDALVAAGFARDEIIVVDDGSTDGTVDMVRNHGIEPLRPEGGNRGASKTRNTGVAASSADIVFFVDSDVVVHDDVRERLERFFVDHPDHAGVFGSYDDAPPAPGAVSRIRNLLHHHVHQRSGGPASTFWTGCGALRRADFQRANGFRTEDEMIEDVGLGLRLARAGRPVMLDPDLKCTHLKQWSWRGFATTDYRHRAQPWTRMMRDPANRDLAHVLNAGPRGKTAVICVGLSMLAVPLLLVSVPLGVAMIAIGFGGLIALERAFLSLVARTNGAKEAVVAISVLWLHYLAAGAGYARVRLFG